MHGITNGKFMQGKYDSSITVKGTGKAVSVHVVREHSRNRGTAPVILNTLRTGDADLRF